MNIQFESIKLSNFLSLGSVDIDLKERGFVLVEGVNNNALDNAKSNGSGKSSIFEGIVWILTGDTIRGTKDVVNKAVGKSTCGELHFSIDGNKYVIIRYREDPIYGNGLKVYYNGEDVSGKGVRDSSKILEQYLPDLNAQLIGSVIVLGQGLPQRFTNNTPSGRKEILEQLSKSDYMIEDIKNKLSLRRIDVNTDLRKVKDDIIAKQSSVSTNNILIERKTKELADLPSPDSYLDSIKEAEEAKANFQANVDSINKEISEKSEKVKSLTETNSIARGLLESQEKEALLPILNDIQNIEKEISVESYKESDTSKKIRDANSVQTVCPYCRRPFDDVHKVDTSEWEAELNTCKAKQQSLREELSMLKTKKEDVERSFLVKKEAYNQVDADINKLNNEINALNRELYTNQDSIHQYQLRIVKYKEEIESLENRKQAIMKDIQDSQSAVEKDLSDIIELTKQQGEFESRVEALNKLVNIASKDFRTYLLESVIDYINTRVKYYSTRGLFNSSEAEFKNDGNQIWIGYAGKQYESLSGGEKQKLDITVQLALRDMLMKVLGFSCNILVLDEIFDNLDEVGCENLINVITSELSDIDSVFIITHHADIAVPYDDKIRVVKNNEGVSNIEQ